MDIQRLEADNAALHKRLEATEDYLQMSDAMMVERAKKKED